LVVASIFGYFAVPADNILYASALWEVITGLGIALFGVPGNILLLCRKRWAVGVCYLATLFALGSVGVGLWQLTLMLESVPPDAAERVPMMVGGAIMAFIRVAILLMYIWALVMVTSSAREPRPQPGFGT
jgi:hypothetical protein